MTVIKRGPTDYLLETIIAYQSENVEQRDVIEKLNAKIRELQNTISFAAAEAKRMETALDKIAQYGENNRTYSNAIIDGVPLADFAARASGVER